MQLLFFSTILGTIISYQSVLAKTDSKGDFYDCEYTVAIAQNTPRPPSCNRGEDSTVITYPGTALPEYKYTQPAGGDDGECNVVIYPSTSYPALTVTLTPCAKTVTLEPWSPYKYTCVPSGSNPTSTVAATTVAAQTFSGNDGYATVYASKEFPATEIVLPFCP